MPNGEKKPTRSALKRKAAPDSALHPSHTLERKKKSVSWDEGPIAALELRKLALEANFSEFKKILEELSPDVTRQILSEESGRFYSFIMRGVCHSAELGQYNEDDFIAALRACLNVDEYAFLRLSGRLGLSEALATNEQEIKNIQRIIQDSRKAAKKFLLPESPQIEPAPVSAVERLQNARTQVNGLEPSNLFFSLSS